MAGSSQCGKTSSHVASGSIRGALKTFELQQQWGRTSDAVRIAFGYCFSGLSLVLKKNRVSDTKVTKIQVGLGFVDSGTYHFSGPAGSDLSSSGFWVPDNITRQDSL